MTDEKTRKIVKEYYTNNREKRLRYLREYYQMNKEKIKDYAHSYYSENKATYAEQKMQYKSENPEKITAHKAVQKAIGSGKLKRQPCETCGKEKAQAHHDDYSKPLEVRWLCALHHQREHSVIGSD